MSVRPSVGRSVPSYFQTRIRRILYRVSDLVISYPRSDANFKKFLSLVAPKKARANWNFSITSVELVFLKRERWASLLCASSRTKTAFDFPPLTVDGIKHRSPKKRRKKSGYESRNGKKAKCDRSMDRRTDRPTW